MKINKLIEHSRKYDIQYVHNSLHMCVGIEQKRLFLQKENMEFVTFEGLMRRSYAARRRIRSILWWHYFFLKHAICRQKSRSTATLLSWVAPQRHLTLRFVAKVELFFVVNVPDIKSWEIESYLQLHVRTNSRFKNHVWFYQLNRYILHYLHMYSIL